jgi:MFS transporter, DHA1 family, staphyloferrin A biosynthesis exporter
LFWSSDLIASVGQFVREVALYWLAYEMTGSAWALGILGFCEAAPRLLLGAVGGVFVDRYDRLRLLTGIQFLCSIPVFGLVALYFLGILQFWHMALLETLWATLRSMNPTAGQSILRDLVPEGELMSAVSLYSIGFNTARIVGPSIGGVLILWIGVGGCMIFYGVCLLFSAVELLGIRIAAGAPRRGGGNIITEFKAGLTYIKATPAILASILAAYVISIFVGTYTRFLAVFAKDVLEVGPEGLGLLMAAPGVGAVFSLIVLGALEERWTRTTLLWFSAKAAPFLLILFCSSRNLWLSIVLLGLFGGMQIIFRTVSRLIIQVEAPRELLGRVMSVFLMDQGMRSLGSVVIGGFVALFGAALGLAATSTVSMAVTGVTFYRLLSSPRRA